MHWIEPTAPIARCQSGLHGRSSARRLLHGQLTPTPAVYAQAASALAALPAELPTGRVTAAGSWDDAATCSALAAVLPPVLAAVIRPRLEWYACRAAAFHNDAHYADVLFGAWCVAGPMRELVFSRSGARVPAGVGDWCVFDPFEPHAVLAPGAQRYDADDYAGQAPSLFLGFELTLTEAVRAAFGVTAAPADGPLLASAIAIHADSGALAAG